jgi:hypothetical protein
LAVVALLFGALAGCEKYQTKAPTPAPKYRSIPNDPKLPVFLRGTIKDLTVAGNTGDFPVSSWGLVVGLRNTGDCTCPSLIRQWMIKQMQVHYVGSHLMGDDKITPDQMLSDPRCAVVAVAAYIPPGARKDDYIDAVVQCMPGNNTTSLSNGMLYRTELRINGYADPVGAVNVYAKAQGNVFVNPAYAATDSTDLNASMRDGLRSGLIPHGARVLTDRPIHLMLRTPSWATSRAIEQRINQRFQTPEPFNDPAAAAQDEGIVHIFVPRSYHGDWEHFVGLVTHLYMNSNPAFGALKAKQLAEEAAKPDAPLMDISYAWEALGKLSIPYITPLMTDPRPQVQFAAARAAAFLDDPYGEDRLVQIATTSGHPFQLNAVQALGAIGDYIQVDSALSNLLNSDESLVRIEAYKVLVTHDSKYIFSKPIHSPLNPENGFMLDMVNSSGPPLIYCSRLGLPRVAIFGRNAAVQTPLVFSTFNSRLTISSDTNSNNMVKIFYTDEAQRRPMQALSGRGVGEIVARLGGASDDGFHFTYGDVVTILQAMVDKKDVAASFVLQQLPQLAKQVEQTPLQPDSGRPQAPLTERTSEIGASLPDLRPATNPVIAPSKNGASRPQ